jgi:hypothetical protein
VYLCVCSSDRDVDVSILVYQVLEVKAMIFGLSQVEKDAHLRKSRIDAMMIIFRLLLFMNIVRALVKLSSDGCAEPD